MVSSVEKKAETVAESIDSKRAAANGHHLKRQGLHKNTHAAAMQHIHAKDAAEGDDITDENKHRCRLWSCWPAAIGAKSWAFGR